MKQYSVCMPGAHTSARAFSTMHKGINYDMAEGEQETYEIDGPAHLMGVSNRSHKRFAFVAIYGMLWMR